MCSLFMRDLFSKLPCQCPKYLQRSMKYLCRGKGSHHIDQESKESQTRIMSSEPEHIRGRWEHQSGSERNSNGPPKMAVEGRRAREEVTPALRSYDFSPGSIVTQAALPIHCFNPEGVQYLMSPWHCGINFPQIL